MYIIQPFGHDGLGAVVVVVVVIVVVDGDVLAVVDVVGEAVVDVVGVEEDKEDDKGVESGTVRSCVLKAFVVIGNSVLFKCV